MNFHLLKCYQDWNLQFNYVIEIIYYGQFLILVSFSLSLLSIFIIHLLIYYLWFNMIINVFVSI